MQATIRYAKSGPVHVAYQVFGNGTVDLVFVPGFISHLEHLVERTGPCPLAAPPRRIRTRHPVRQARNGPVGSR